MRQRRAHDRQPRQLVLYRGRFIGGGGVGEALAVDAGVVEPLADVRGHGVGVARPGDVLFHLRAQRVKPFAVGECRQFRPSQRIVFRVDVGVRGVSGLNYAFVTLDRPVIVRGLGQVLSEHPHRCPRASVPLQVWCQPDACLRVGGPFDGGVQQLSRGERCRRVPARPAR